MFDWLETSQLSQFIRTDVWGWPVALTLHALGTALLVGLIFVIGLRFLGLFEQVRYSSLSRLFPLIWFAFGLQVLSGFFLWMTKASRYVADGAFELKVLLIVVGLVLTYQFSQTMQKEAVSWDQAGAVSSHKARLVAALMVIWAAVLIAGRLTGYMGSFV
jgi:hypothetical protein